jgi:hypothetical protein
MMLSPICWAAAFSAALTFRRALRRGPLAGTGAVPGGGAGGGGGVHVSPSLVFRSDAEGPANAIAADA